MNLQKFVPSRKLEKVCVHVYMKCKYVCRIVYLATVADKTSGSAEVHTIKKAGEGV